MNQRLYRSRDDRIIAGVAGGVADYLRLDPSIVRIVWAILAVFSGGLLFLVYIVMWIVVPEEPYDWGASEAGGAPGAVAPPPPPPPVIPGWTAPGQPTAPAPGTEPPTPGTEPPTPGTEPAPAEMISSAAPEAAPATEPAAQPAGGWVPPAATAAAPTTATPTDWRDARLAERAARRAARRANRGASGAIIFGLILVLVGAFFLVEMYVPTIDTGRFWPIVLVIIGAVLLIASIRPGSGEPEP